MKITFEGSLAVNGSVGGLDFEGIFYVSSEGGSGWDEFVVDGIDHDDDLYIDYMNEVSDRLMKTIE